MASYKMMFVDDHPLIVDGIVNITKKISDVEVIATANDANEALELLDKFAEQLDILIFDYSMPGMNGIELLREIKKRNYHFRKLLLTTFEDSNVFDIMLQDGLDGIVLKSAAVSEILGTAKFLVDNPQSTVVGTEVKQLVTRKESPLSTQDSEILILIATGHHVKEIAKEMSFSERTIKYHLTEIYSKLGAVNRAQAVAIAISQNWIQL
ncbi:response regulator [Liquorilactobacillus cacaonum]|uniref:Two-component response regulator n=1 Tax=Liquorilactobacillus cacaonum DSM 21116 TaxID=1423729 RepID=A0A0R2CEJ7_9LACO|nr:response regulator transcription factor [Liquorilactobacillus cacaonum]KRM90129.1 hypothetical protein FC80_GL001466 [Liquorilactobacillus cacaonum DSM 21116]